MNRIWQYMAYSIWYRVDGVWYIVYDTLLKVDGIWHRVDAI